jgi:trimeric autotransporter adhesin
MQQEAGATSDYHSFQFTLQKRFSRGMSLLAAYTLSKSIDDAAGNSTRFYTQATGDPQDLRGSRGLSDFDRTHRLVVSYNLAIPNPFGAGARGVTKVFSDWELSGITTIQSGSPFDITNPESNLDHDGQAGSPGTGGRADLVSGVPLVNAGGVSSKLNNYLNPAAFSPAPRSRFGTLGRNVVRGPGANLWDLRITRNFPIRENFNVRFLSEWFNVWNHPAFGNPGGVLGTPAFGTIRSTLSNARIIQFGLKLEY